MPGRGAQRTRESGGVGVSRGEGVRACHTSFHPTPHASRRSGAGVYYGGYYLYSDRCYMQTLESENNE